MIGVHVIEGLEHSGVGSRPVLVIIMGRSAHGSNKADITSDAATAYKQALKLCGEAMYGKALPVSATYIRIDKIQQVQRTPRCLFCNRCGMCAD